MNVKHVRTNRREQPAKEGKRINPYFSGIFPYINGGFLYGQIYLKLE
jgi:hypothetical protein